MYPYSTSMPLYRAVASVGQGARPPPDKVLALLVGLGRYMENFKF